MGVMGLFGPRIYSWSGRMGLPPRLNCYNWRIIVNCTMYGTNTNSRHDEKQSSAPQVVSIWIGSNRTIPFF